MSKTVKLGIKNDQDEYFKCSGKLRMRILLIFLLMTSKGERILLLYHNSNSLLSYFNMRVN